MKPRWIIIFAAVIGVALAAMSSQGQVITFQADQSFVNNVNASFGPCPANQFVVATSLGQPPTCNTIQSVSQAITGTGTANFIATWSGTSTMGSDSRFQYASGVLKNSGLYASQVGGLANVTPTALFSDGTHCGLSGSMAATSTTHQMQITMGSSNPTTACPVTFGTSADCPNGATCTANDASSPIPLQVASTASSVTITSFSGNMKTDVVNVNCWCF